jgi:hypothetical protein
LVRLSSSYGDKQDLVERGKGKGERERRHDLSTGDLVVFPKIAAEPLVIEN